MRETAFMSKESVLPSDVDVLIVTVTEVEGRAVLEEVESQVSQDLLQGENKSQADTYS